MKAASGEGVRGLATGALSVLGVVAAFSSFVLFSRLGIASSTFAALDLLAIRFAVAAAIALPLLVVRRPRWPRPILVVAMAACGGLGFSALAYFGFSLAPASHGSSLVHGMLPLTTAALSACIWRRLPRHGLHLLGLALVSAGALGLVLSAPGGAYLQGDVLLVAASAAWSLYALLIRYSGLLPTDAAAVVVVVSAASYLPAYACFANPLALLGAGGGALALQVAVQGVLVGFGSVWLYSIATARLGAQRVAAAASTVPAIVTLAAVPLLGEELSWSTALSVGLVVGGALLAVKHAQST